MYGLILILAFTSTLVLVGGQSDEKRVVCYYINWSMENRDGDAPMQPTEIDPHVCTHVVYAFAPIVIEKDTEPTDFKFVHDEGGYQDIVGLKEKNPKLVVLLAMGGFLQGSFEFSKITANQFLRKKFITSIIEILRQYNFDGVNFDWQYPAYNGGASEDFHSFGNLTQELRAEFENEAMRSFQTRLVMSILVTNIEEIIIRGYKLEVLSRNADFLVLMALYHYPDEGMTNHIAPLYSLPDDTVTNFNVDGVVKFLLNQGVPSEKLVLGITAYGTVYRLANASLNGFNSPALDTPAAGMGYWKLCQMEKSNEWTKSNSNSERAGPYIYKDTTWIPYDDPAMVKMKAEYAVKMKLGGIWFWALNYMDHMGKCNGFPYPLIQAAREGLSMNQMVPDPVDTKPVNNSLSNPMDGMKTKTATGMMGMETMMDVITKSNFMKKKRVVCYFSSDSLEKDGEDGLQPDKIDPFTCTHIIYSHAVINLAKGVVFRDPIIDITRGGYRKLIMLKERNHELKVMLSVGGPGSGRIFSQTSRCSQGRSMFVQSAVKFLRHYGFDGLDIDWRDPTSRDKKFYNSLTQEMLAEFENEAMDTNADRLLLSITLPIKEKVIKDSFDLKMHSKSVDFMNVMAFGYHMADGVVTSHSAPLYTLPFDIDPYHSINNLVKLILSFDVPPSRLNIGISVKATKYNLVDPTMTSFNSPVNGDSSAQETLINFGKLCKIVMYDGGWMLGRPYPDIAGPYVFKKKTWLSFDDPIMVMKKAAYIINNDLGGITFWTLNDMDFEGVCFNKTYPLIRAAKDVFGLRWNNSKILIANSNLMIPMMPTPLNVECTTSNQHKPPRHAGDPTINQMTPTGSNVQCITSNQPPHHGSNLMVELLPEDIQTEKNETTKDPNKTLNIIIKVHFNRD